MSMITDQIPPIVPIEPKYVIFDAMLATNELRWVANISPIVLNPLELTKNLEKLYLALDNFQTLVYSYNSGNIHTESITKTYRERIAPLLSIVLTQVDGIECFKPYGSTIEQLKAIEILMHDR